MAGALRFEILGPVRAYRDGEPVDIGPLNQRAVLAILLLHAGEPVPIRRIIAALWGDDPPENGVDVVQRYVGGLRRALDPERTSLIALAGDGYLISAGDEAVDAAGFRAALARARDGHRTGRVDSATAEVRRAFELWRAEPLAGLTGSFFESARARLTAERDAATGLLAPPAAAGPPLPAAGPSSSVPSWSVASPSLPAEPVPAPVEPTRVEAPRSSRRMEPTRVEVPEPAARMDPTRVEPPQSAETRMVPAQAEPTRVEQADPIRAGRAEPTWGESAEATRVEPAGAAGAQPAETARARSAEPARSSAPPGYPEAVDPWAGHDLFPPDGTG